MSAEGGEPVRRGEVIAGKYLLERPLAHGGMGSVWRARHVDLDVHVAVKFMDAAVAATEAGRARFEREAKSAAQLRSPHVVLIHDYGVHEGTPYIAMELLQGEDLKARLDREGRLPVADVAAILGQAAKGLGKAHRAGIVHRDLKPANVFLAADEDGLVVKILDFGVAKASLRSTKTKFVTRGGVVLGSIQYMSPEQARGAREIDHRADLWSLGVIAFRAVAGQQPFDFDPEDPTTAIALLSRGPRLVEAPIVKALGPAAEAFFARAFARDIGDRFQDARELAAAFTALAGPLAAAELPPPSGAPSSRDGADASLPVPLARAKGDREASTTISDTVPEAGPRAWLRPVLIAAGGALVICAGVLALRSALREAEPEPEPIRLTATPVVQIAPDPAPAVDAAAPDAGEDAAVGVEGGVSDGRR